MPVLSARHLTKAFSGDPLFKDVSITIARGERVGLLGQNGAGKSTLLKVLAGEEPADEGVVEVRRRASVIYLPQEPALDPEATGRTIVESGLSEWRTTKARFDEISARISAGETTDALVEEQATVAEEIERLGGWDQGHVVEEISERLSIADLDRAVGTLSGGERRRVALARLLVARPDLAILDEPTNHLDAETIEWLEEHLATSFRGAALVVTHDRYVLDALCQRMFELEHGSLIEYRGNYTSFIEQKADAMAHADRVEQNRLNLLRRETAWLSRGAQARSTKQKARIQRAEALIAVEGPKETRVASLGAAAGGARSTGKSILDLEHVEIGVGERTLVKDLTLHLVTGDRIGIIGRNGAGKTTLLRAITGEQAPRGGKVTVGHNTRIAVVDQSRANLENDWSIFDNVAGREGAERSGGGVIKLGERTLELRQYLELFLFDPKKQRQKVGSLSGGERARVGLAKILRNGDNLLLLDEPTNDLDVMTLSALEDLLESWPGCAIVVSHDRAFLNNVATGILALDGEGDAVFYQGSYDTYRSLAPQPKAKGKGKDDSRAASVQAPAPRSAPPPSKPKVKQKPLSFAEKKELEGILERISEAEERLAQAERELADPALYTAGADEATQVRTRLATAQADVERLTTRWEELEARKA